MLKNIVLKTITVAAAIACFLCLCGVVDSDHPIACTIGAFITLMWCMLFAAINGGLA